MGYAVSEGKSEEAHAEYRQKAVDQMRSSGGSAALIARAGRNYSYAENEEIQALSKALKRPVIVVSWRESDFGKEIAPKKPDSPAASVQAMGFDDPEVRGGEPLVVTLEGDHFNLVPTEGKDLSALKSYVGITS